MIYHVPTTVLKIKICFQLLQLWESHKLLKVKICAHRSSALSTPQLTIYLQQPCHLLGVLCNNISFIKAKRNKEVT